jgi:hypothetical protein
MVTLSLLFLDELREQELNEVHLLGGCGKQGYFTGRAFPAPFFFPKKLGVGLSV